MSNRDWPQADVDRTGATRGGPISWSPGETEKTFSGFAESRDAASKGRTR